MLAYEDVYFAPSQRIQSVFHWIATLDGFVSSVTTVGARIWTRGSCFTRPGLDTARFLAALYSRQIAWMSEVRLAGGAPVLRACITSFRTTADDIEAVVRELGTLV